MPALAQRLCGKRHAARSLGRPVPACTHGRRRIAAPLGAAADPDVEPAPLPFTFGSAQGMQLQRLYFEPAAEAAPLWAPALETYVGDLLEERQREAAMFPQPPEAAEGEAEAAPHDPDDWENDPVLLRRMAEVREAERGQILQELLYMGACWSFKAAGLRPMWDLDLLASSQPAAPPATVTAAAIMAPSGVVAGSAAAGQQGGQPQPGAGQPQEQQQQQEEQQPPQRPGGLVAPAVADAICGYVRATLRSALAEQPPAAPLAIDRVQAARLFMGMVEFGAFARGLQAACEARGLALGDTSDVLVAAADELDEGALRSLSHMGRQDTFVAAVRHAGQLFGLVPQPDPTDLLALPYEDLARPITSITTEPAAAIWEFYSAPGSAEAAAAALARARAKQSRGWDVAPDDLPPAGGALPEADLLQFRLVHFESLLVEAACLGAALWQAEQQVTGALEYPLRPRTQSALQPLDAA